MKIKHTFSLLALMTGSMLGHSAMAQAPAPGASIDFVGGIIGQICDITVNNGNTVVQLPQITANQLPSIGATAGRTPFQVRFDNCASSVSQVQINFSSPDAGDISGRIASGVDGVSLMLDGGGTQVRATQVASETLVVGDHSATIAPDGTGNIEYAVSYYREAGTMSTGAVNATVNLTVAYL